MRSPGYQKKRDAVKINTVLEKVMTKLGNVMTKPVQSFRDKGLDVAVWENRNGGYSFTFRKTYKNKESGQYVETKYFYKEDAERLIELLKQAVSYASNRADHDVEHMASGGFNGQPKKQADVDDDIDNIPF
jgi:hypothetical protein